jgi:hypothetical protein
MRRLLHFAGVFFVVTAIGGHSFLAFAQPASAPDECLALPSSVIAWWRADQTYFDEIGGFSIERVTGVNFAEGAVGRCWHFDREDSEVLLWPSPRLSINGSTFPDISFEAWVAPQLSTNRQVFLTWQSSNDPDAVEFFFEAPSAGNLWTIGIAQANSTLSMLAPIQDNGFQHLAFCWNPAAGTISFYLNGALHTSSSSVQNPGFRDQIKFGGKKGSRFRGRIDEVLFYSRALSAEEVRLSAQARPGGYCQTQNAPSFLMQPQNRATGAIAEPLIIQTELNGGGPISYQWRRYGTNVPSQTEAHLILLNLNREDAGFYDLVASNAFGSATSRVATVIVNLLGNGSFDKGSFPPWQVVDLPSPRLPIAVSRRGRGIAAFVSNPVDGPYSVTHGFAGDSPGTIHLYQELVELSPGLQLEFSFRAGWNLQVLGNATLPRHFRFRLEPAGGGDPLLAYTVLTLEPSTKNLAPTWQTERVDLSPFAGKAVRLVFEWAVPEPGFFLTQFELDAVRLINTSGPPIRFWLEVGTPPILNLSIESPAVHWTLLNSILLDLPADRWASAGLFTNAAAMMQLRIPIDSTPARFFRSSAP